MRKAIEAEMKDSAEWTAQTWYTVAVALEKLASDKTLPRKLRQWLRDRAEAAWVTGDWRNGISPEMWAAECAIYEAEDDAMEARVKAEEAMARANVVSTGKPMQFELSMA